MGSADPCIRTLSNLEISSNFSTLIEDFKTTTTMSEQKQGEKHEKQEKLTGMQSMKQFLWNPNTGEFFGRTGLSWLKITIFYIIFYACLAAFWALMLVIFYQTLDDREPKWKMTESRIGDNPGLGYKPRPPTDNIESTLINLNNDALKTHYVSDLQKFIDVYHNNTNGGHAEDAAKCSGDGKSRDPAKYCPFKPDRVGGNDCNKNNNYGYPTGKPCVAIKLNRIYDWKPESYATDQVPKELKEHLQEKGVTYNPDMVYVTCSGQDASSKESLITSEVEYHGIKSDNNEESIGIPFYYFPYTNQPGYQSPFMYVQFKGINTGTMIFVECKAWAKNIVHDKLKRKGSVTFEFLSSPQ